MMIIAGNGRNVGKTTFARMMIQQFSKDFELIGLKTSPHRHELDENLQLIKKSDEFIVAEEKGQSLKDSSLLLQAGASRVYLIMAKQEALESAFSYIAKGLENHMVIAESGGLSEIVEPGIFFFIRKHGSKIYKPEYLKYHPIQVQNGSEGFDFDSTRISFRSGRFLLAKLEK